MKIMQYLDRYLVTLVLLVMTLVVGAEPLYGPAVLPTPGVVQEFDSVSLESGELLMDDEAQVSDDTAETQQLDKSQNREEEYSEPYSSPDFVQVDVESTPQVTVPKERPPVSDEVYVFTGKVIASEKPGYVTLQSVDHPAYVIALSLEDYGSSWWDKGDLLQASFVERGGTYYAEELETGLDNSSMFLPPVEKLAYDSVKVLDDDKEEQEQAQGAEEESNLEESDQEKTADLEELNEEQAADSEEADLEDETAVEESGEELEPGDSEDLNSEETATAAEPEDSESSTEESNNYPLVVGVQVEGNTLVSDREVLEQIKTVPGKVLDPAIANEDLQIIFDMGYFTDVRLSSLNRPNGVAVVFRVLENPVVDNIVFEGNEQIPTEELLGLLETKAGQILNSKVLQEDVLRINQYYLDQLGLVADQTHVPEVRMNEGTLTLVVDDGIIVEDVVITGVTVFPEDKVLREVNIEKGKLLDQRELEAAVTNIASLYEGRNWVIDNIVPSIDAETGIVSIEVIEVVVSEIRVEGNYKTKTATVTENLRTKPGQVMNRRRLRQDMERLRGLGFFKGMDVLPTPTGEPGEVMLVLDLQEQQTGNYSIAAGYAGGGSGALRSGITGGLGITERNLFGNGQTVSANWNRGTYIESLTFSFFDPAINDNQDSLGITVFSNRGEELPQPVNQGSSNADYAYYDDVRKGINVTYGHPFDDYIRGYLSARHEQISLVRSDNSIYEPIGLSDGVLNALGVGLVYDSRDDFTDPYNGTFINLGGNFAGFGGDYNYEKYILEARHYLPLGERHTLASRIWLGKVSDDAPVSEYFYAGGTDSLRGYRRNSYFGTRFLVGNLEYRFPIGDIKFLRGTVFADAGNAWFPGAVNESKIFVNAGVGLRITFPKLNIGVIRVDLATGDDGTRTTIGVGQNF